MMTSQTLPIGYMLEQKYRVIKLLGQGAFGATYLVEHLHFSTKHVIKEYLPDSAIRSQSNTVIPKSQGDVDNFTWGLRRFFDEAKLLYRLNHPNIVKVTDLFEAHGTAYFVMPYLGSHTFQTWINHHPKPTEGELLSIFIPLLEGLKYIHSQGLLHRDIKPENILITSDNIPIFIDFGSARNAIGKKSKLLTRVLTPHFAPIEQYSQNAEFSVALDLYSLAASIYQSIVGDYPPLATDRVMQDSIMILAQQPKYQQRYSQHFLQAIDKNLKFKPQDRDQSATEMQSNLLGYQEASVSNHGTPLEHSEEWVAWQQALSLDTVESYQHYINIYPVGQYIQQAREYLFNIQYIQEYEFWKAAVEQNTQQSYESYLSTYPYGQFVEQAEQSLQYFNPSSASTYETQGTDDKLLSTDEYERPKFFSLSRIGRLHYWNYGIALNMMTVILFMLIGVLAQSGVSDLTVILIGILYLANIVGHVFLSLRRVRDLGLSQHVLWSYLLIITIPIFQIYLLSAKGNENINQYGYPTKIESKDKWFSILMIICAICIVMGLQAWIVNS